LLSMIDDIIIRKAVSADLEALLEFEQDLINDERPFDTTFQEGIIHYYDLAKMIDSTDVQLMVAECNNVVIGSGYARIEKPKPYLKHTVDAYFGFMYVLPAYRRMGVNKKIIERLQAWATEKKIFDFRLDVYHANYSAIKAYENAGFVKHMIEMRMKKMPDTGSGIPDTG
jgi:GNAT superfamily N-acetyltransferase